MSINKRMYKLCSHIMEYCIEKNEQTTDIYDNMDESHRYDIELKKKKRKRKPDTRVYCMIQFQGSKEWAKLTDGKRSLNDDCPLRALWEGT